MSITATEWKNLPSEHQLQRLVLDYLDLNAADDVYAFAVPNAGLRSARMGARMKAEGLRAGAADICIMLPNGKVAWLEMKSHKGRQSIKQKGFEAHCKRLDHPYTVANTFHDAVTFLEKIGAVLAGAL
jgi:hypothetical protein